MGCYLSTHAKSRSRHYTKNFHSAKGRASRGSAHYVIPVTGSSLENAAHKYELGKNAMKEIADRGTGNAFLIEKPALQVTVNENGSGHSPQHENMLQHQVIGSPSSRAPNESGSKHEAFFDTDNAFNNESDDEFMSVCGDFSSWVSNGPPYPANNAAESQRSSLASLQADMSKVDDWMAGTSEEMGSLHSPPPEDEAKSIPFGVRNGIAALAGSPQDSLRADEMSLNIGSPRKSFQMAATESKVTSSRPKWERAVSDLLGRKQSASDASPARNAGCTSPPVAGEANKSGDSKSVFDGLCLPRLRTTVPTIRSRSLSPMSFKKKSSMMKFSFRRKASADLHDDPDSVSSKYYVERPLGGSQVSHCSADKPVDGCWSEVSSAHFKIRGKYYAKDKKKFSAPNFSAFVPVGVDLLMSPQKIDHVAQYVELPFQEITNEAESLPAVFIVNIQLPLYPPSIFMGDTDGEGLSLVLYFKLSDELAKTAPPYFKDILTKFVNDETEKVKSFVGDSVLPFRDRLKVVARCVNPEEVQLSAAEKKLLVSYNEKPVLSRPQHCFHKGANYLEVDLDVHRFSYIARKGFDTFRDRLKSCILDVGLTIQGTRPDELPEQILAAVRLHKLDFGDYRILQAASSAHSVRSDDVNGIPTSP